jgi:FkbM family methyltransferase
MRYEIDEIGSRDHRTVLLSSPGRKGRNRTPLLRHLAIEHIVEVLSRLQVNCVLDVGANRGQYASKLREAGYTGRIISFEPLPHLADEVEAASAGDPEWRLVRCALGREDTESEMNVDSEQGTLSSLLDASEFGRTWNRRLREEEDVLTVPVRRLDGMWEDLLKDLEDPRVYLKMDTQGFDLEAFAGAGDRVDDILAMQSEIASLPIYDGMPKMTEQLEIYQGAGFILSGLYPVGVYRPTLGVIEFDAVMVRPEAVRASRGGRGARSSVAVAGAAAG